MRVRRFNRTVEVRRLWRTDEIAGYHWDHLRQIIRVCREVRTDDGTVISRDDRFFATSATTNRLSSDEWNLVVRNHWRVEAATDEHLADLRWASPSCSGRAPPGNQA